MQELVMTPGTVVVLVILAAWAVWAVRRMTHRGLCDCGDHCGDGCGKRCKPGSKRGCSSCSQASVDKMLSDLEKSSK